MPGCGLGRLSVPANSFAERSCSGDVNFPIKPSTPETLLDFLWKVPDRKAFPMGSLANRPGIERISILENAKIPRHQRPTVSKEAPASWNGYRASKNPQIGCHQLPP
jgi:hypothetical protein